jgi:hypothetical protein
MLFPDTGAPVVQVLAAVAGRLLARLLHHRPGVRPGAVMLAGGYASPAGAQTATGRSAPVTGSSLAGSGAWRAENSDTRHRLYDVACLSALRCEAVGTAGTIVATANGGRTWRAQANPLRGPATALYQ